MVPDHVGIDSRWVIHHPDSFLSMTEPPFPGYRSVGPDLAEDARVGIRLEDGYWDKTDAGVVFGHHDKWTGDDAESITATTARASLERHRAARLPEWPTSPRGDRDDPRRRAASSGDPLRRRDGARKEALRRLWYPEPGQGGAAIPSRADHGTIKQDEFIAAIPVEFWREFVDTVAPRRAGHAVPRRGVWLMEGYFVRTLGMHRVYNTRLHEHAEREEDAGYRECSRTASTSTPRSSSGSSTS